MPDYLPLPAPIRDEPLAVNARRMSEWDGPNGNQFQFWVARGGPVIVELHPDGSVFLWQPLAHKTRSMATFAGELRAYLAGTA